MPKQETILSRAECAREFNISETMVQHYMDSGEVRFWWSGEGKGRSCQIPLSSAQPVLEPFKTALRTDEIEKLTGMTKSGVCNAVAAGRLKSLRPKNYPHSKIAIYVARDEFERWNASRVRPIKSEAQRPLALVPDPTPEPQAEAPRWEREAHDQQTSLVASMARQLDTLSASVNALTGVVQMDHRARTDILARIEQIARNVDAVAGHMRDGLTALDARQGMMDKTIGDLAAAIELRLGEVAKSA